MGRTKRLRELEKAFPAWRVTITRGGHIRLTHHLTGKTIFTSSSPSDWRTDKNLASLIRKAERGA